MNSSFGLSVLRLLFFDTLLKSLVSNIDLLSFAGKNLNLLDSLKTSFRNEGVFFFEGNYILMVIDIALKV